MSEADTRVDGADLERFTREVLLAAGVAETHAETVAHALVRASLRGVDSHGVARLPVYVEKFEGGGFDPDPDIEVTALGDAAVLVDAGDGPGQSAARLAMAECVERAAATGAAVAGVANSNHFGTAAYYTQHAAAHDCVGLAMTNVEPDVVPFGGASRVLGTNPISFAIPTPPEVGFPVTLDMATSVVARGKIDHVASEEGRDIPDHWAVDAAGEPTTDPDIAEALRPAGGPKGYGLAIVVDVLAGLLTGMGPSPEAGPLYDSPGVPMRLGHFVCAIDVGTFRDVDAFEASVGELAANLKAVPPREGFDEVLLPGEIEARTRAERERDGVPVIAGVLDDLDDLSRAYGVDLPDET